MVQWTREIFAVSATATELFVPAEVDGEMEGEISRSRPSVRYLGRRFSATPEFDLPAKECWFTTALARYSRGGKPPAHFALSYSNGSVDLAGQIPLQQSTAGGEIESLDSIGYCLGSKVDTKLACTSHDVIEIAAAD